MYIISYTRCLVAIQGCESQGYANLSVCGRRKRNASLGISLYDARLYCPELFFQGLCLSLKSL
jgi:hypothetical protein